MKHKEVQIGGDYILKSNKYSNPAASKRMFEQLLGKRVTVVDKYSDLKNKNVIRIEGIVEDTIVEMWCSPYDLEHINESS